MPEASVTVRRILIGAESVADAPRAVRLLPVLAEGAPAVFGGLLVVDQALVAAHSCFGGRVVTTGGQIEAAPDAERLKGIVEGEAQAFRQMLSEAAGAVGAEWGAEVSYGTLAAGLAAMTDVWDIVVLGHRLLHRRRGPVVVVDGGSRENRDLQNMAIRVAAELGTDIETVRTSGSTLAQIAGRLDRLSASAIVLDAGTSLFDGVKTLTELLAVARCPIVVLGGARLQPRIAHSVQILPSEAPKT